MNKRQLIAQAKRVVDERRFAAEEKADRTLRELRKNEEWNALERQLRAAQVDLAMGTGNAQQLSDTVARLEKEQRSLLKKLNVKSSALVPQYSCKLCNDAGYVDGKACRCLQTELRRLIIADSNLFDADFTFEKSTETDAHNVSVYRQIRKTLEKGKCNVLLCGEVGTGKTYLLTACANEAAKLNRSVLFVTAYSLNAELLKAHLDGVEATETLIDSLIDVDLLLIDDLGTEKIYNNVTGNDLFALLNERIVAHKQTFFTTNLELQQINDRYDERIVSRLMDRNITFVAKLSGADKRLAKR